MDLYKDGDVDADLQQTTDPELDGGGAGDEVDRLEHVSTRPHGHHLATVEDRGSD